MTTPKPYRRAEVTDVARSTVATSLQNLARAYEDESSLWSDLAQSPANGSFAIATFGSVATALRREASQLRLVSTLVTETAWTTSYGMDWLRAGQRQLNDRRSIRQGIQ